MRVNGVQTRGLKEGRAIVVVTYANVVALIVAVLFGVLALSEPLPQVPQGASFLPPHPLSRPSFHPPFHPSFLPPFPHDMKPVICAHKTKLLLHTIGKEGRKEAAARLACPDSSIKSDFAAYLALMPRYAHARGGRPHSPQAGSRDA